MRTSWLKKTRTSGNYILDFLLSDKLLSKKANQIQRNSKTITEQLQIATKSCAFFEGAKACQCSRSWTLLKNEPSVAKICIDTTEKILPINFNRDGRSADDLATEGEISQLRSVVGSIAWIARQCRPDMAYYTSKLQSVAAKAQVKHLTEANKVLKQATELSKIGLYFKPKAIDWNNCILVSISDASWAGETLIDDDGRVFPRKSRMGRVFVLADPAVWDLESANCHVIGWKSQMIARTCRSTMASV